MYTGPDWMPKVPVPEAFYSLTDESAVTTVREWFMASLKNAGPVRSTFFPNAPAAKYAAYDSGVVDDLAVAMVCSAISRSPLYQFSRTIHQQKAGEFWRSKLQNQGPSLVFASYISALGHQFVQNHIANPFMAPGVADRLTSDEFISLQANRITAGDSNWVKDLSLALCKLYTLLRGSEEPVLKKWRETLPGAGALDNWNRPSHIIPPHLYEDITFLSEVNAAISREHVDSSWDHQTTTYGRDVENFVCDGRPNQLGFYTGARPENKSILVYFHGPKW